MQGSTFDPVLAALDSNGNPIDWTGFKACMQARPSADDGTVLFSLYNDITIPGAAGTATVGNADANIVVSGTNVNLYLSAAQTTFTPRPRAPRKG